MIPASRIPDPTPERMAEIRLNRTRHLLKLKDIWARSMRRARTPRSRSKYNPSAEDLKHAQQALR